jgi:Ca2+-transporting ATPase
VQRALAFVCLVSGNLAILIASRSLIEPFWSSMRKWNPALPALCFAATAVLVLVIGLPGARALFGFDRGAPADLWRAVIAAAAPVLTLDVLKPLLRLDRTA